MAKAEKKSVPDTGAQLAALDAALRESGVSIAEVLVTAAKHYYGLDLMRVIHPVEESK